MEILGRSFYQRDTVQVARNLIGKLLIRVDGEHYLVGRIIETEAYKGSDDPASHAYRRKTERNKAMFEEVGRAYIYFVYGAHFALNLVAREYTAEAGAVLIRAVEPIEGLEYMRRIRSKDAIQHLTSGPGKLAQAYGINQALYGHDVTQPGALYIVDAQHEREIVATTRIGIRTATDKLWRFIEQGNRYLSRK